LTAGEADGASVGERIAKATSAAELLAVEPLLIYPGEETRAHQQQLVHQRKRQRYATNALTQALRDALGLYNKQRRRSAPIDALAQVGAPAQVGAAPAEAAAAPAACTNPPVYVTLNGPTGDGERCDDANSPYSGGSGGLSEPGAPKVMLFGKVEKDSEGFCMVKFKSFESFNRLLTRSGARPALTISRDGWWHHFNLVSDPQAIVRNEAECRIDVSMNFASTSADLYLLGRKCEDMWNRFQCPIYGRSHGHDAFINQCKTSASSLFVQSGGGPINCSLQTALENKCAAGNEVAMPGQPGFGADVAIGTCRSITTGQQAVLISPRDRKPNPSIPNEHEVTTASALPTAASAAAPTLVIPGLSLKDVF
jgi:hypothetical protein